VDLLTQARRGRSKASDGNGETRGFCRGTIAATDLVGFTLMLIASMLNDALDDFYKMINTASQGKRGDPYL